jgi:hypothetical protein
MILLLSITFSDMVLYAEDEKLKTPWATVV